MGRPSKGGAHKVTAKGQTYYYAWKGAGAPRLQSQPGTKAFDAELKRLLATREAPKPPPVRLSRDTLGDVVTAYLASPEFLRKPKSPDKPRPERTQRDYRRLASILCTGQYSEEISVTAFDDLPLAALHERPDETRGEFLEWRDEIAAHSARWADYAWTFLNIVLNWGKQRGKLKLNPCRDAGVKSLYQGTRRASLWLAPQVDLFCREASPELALGVMLAYWTAQRQGDLLRLPWSAYDGDVIALTQSKVNVPVVVPVATPLKALLDSTPRKSPIILVNQEGHPWSEGGFQHMIYRTRERLKIEPTFNDLRGTAISELALAGATEPEIAAVSGHQGAIQNPVMRKHYLEMNVGLARAAIAKLEAYRGRVVSFPTARSFQ